MLRDLSQRAWPALVQSGWAAYFRARDPLVGTLQCVFHPGCQKALTGDYAPNYFLAVLPAAGGVLIAALGAALVTTRAPAKLPGVARWATRRDLKRLEAKPQAGYMGYLWEPTQEEKKVAQPKVKVPFPERVRNGHVAVIGRPGAGKTTAFFLPNLLQDAEQGHTAVVFDFKFPDPFGGLTEALSYYHAQGHRVYTFTPFEPQSMILPLLEGGETREGALSIAEMLVPKPKQSGEEFYRNLEKTIITALVYGLCNDPDLGPPSPRDLLRKLIEGPEKLRAYLGNHKRPEVREWAGQIASNLSRMAADKQMGLIMGLVSRLIIFDSPRLNAATATPPPGASGVISLREVFGGEKPALLYIGIPQAEIQAGKGQALLQLIKRLIDKAALEVAQKHGGKLPRHAVIYLDEFPSFGPLPNMMEVLATMRSRRVAYMLSFQDHSQGYAVYGQDEFDAMFGTIQTVVAWPSYLSKADREWLSQYIGNTTTLERSYGEAAKAGPLGGFDRRASETLRERERALLTMDEMQVFPQEEAVVITPSVPPIRAYMPYIYSDGSLEGLIRHPWAAKRKEYLRYDPMGVLAMCNLEGGARVETVLPGEGEDAYAALFVTWVEQMLEYLPKVEERKKPGESVRWAITKLPKDLEQNFTQEWEKRGWLVALSADGYGITELGTSVLPEKVLRKLRWMRENDSLMRFVRKHKDRLEGLPSFKGGVPPVGRVEKTSLWVPEEAANDLPEEVRKLGRLMERDGKRWLVFQMEVLPRVKTET